MPYSVHYTDTEWEKERKEVQGRDQSDFGYQTGGGKWMKDKVYSKEESVATGGTNQ